MKLLGKEIDVFKEDFTSHQKMIFTKNKSGNTYEKLIIELYTSGDGLDIDRVRYAPKAIVDGTVDRFYPMAGESKIAYKNNKLPRLFQKVFIYLTFDNGKGKSFKGFFGIS